MYAILGIGVLAFIAGYILGVGSQRRLIMDLSKTTLAVLAEIAEILDRLTTILDEMATDKVNNNLGQEGGHN